MRTQHPGRFLNPAPAWAAIAALTASAVMANEPSTNVAIRPKVAYLGVATAHVPEALRAHVNLPAGTGLIVDFIEPGSPAASALQTNDILVRFNDQVLVNPEQLAVLVRTNRSGATATLHVLRHAEARRVEVALGEKEDGPEAESWRVAPAPFHMQPPPMLHFQFPGGQPGRWMDNDEFDRLFKQMRQMFDDARLDGSMHQQLMERMSNLLSHGDSPPLPPGATPAGEALSPNATATLVDGDRVITISGEKGHRRLTITDKGRRIFEGPVDTDADRARIPQAYQPDARRLFDLNVGP